ncbi:MAG: hypothetical protein ACTSW1_07770 [Candidatus Hodarchaeales archaeon]
MKTPCKECICVPICIHRTFQQTIANCSMIREFLYTYDNFMSKVRPDHNERIEAMWADIGPTQWRAWRTKDGSIRIKEVGSP